MLFCCRALNTMICDELHICDGYIHCGLPQHDEANCSACPSNLPHRCACNQKEEMTCSGFGHVCYSDESKNQFFCHENFFYPQMLFVN